MSEERINLKKYMSAISVKDKKQNEKRIFSWASRWPEGFRAIGVKCFNHT
jgi:hypothetical protein